jgi:hypothetical protein
MKLKNNKIIGKDDLFLEKCIETLPPEILKIIINFHSCSNCFENNYYHCHLCNNCFENYERHLICKKCNICYPYTKSIIFANRKYDFVLNKHIHCDICDRIKKYSILRMAYYCQNCSSE